jgi:hypothetical protein
MAIHEFLLTSSETPEYRPPPAREIVSLLKPRGRERTKPQLPYECLRPEQVTIFRGSRLLEELMYKALMRLIPAMFVIATLSISARASDFPAGSLIPIGYISYDVTGTNVAQFDIVNLTGANASSPGDLSFPITTPLSFSDLSLVVDFSGGQSKTFGSSYFTLDSDGFDFDGEQLSTLSGWPTGLLGATSAVLTGDISTLNVTLNDGTTEPLSNAFSATIADPSGLQDTDLAIINATVTPEPATWTLLGMGLLLLGLGRAGSLRLLKKRNLGIALSLGCALFLLPGALKAQATVKLSTLTSPSSGTSGTSTVNVSGSGYPSGTIAPANVLVSLAASCGGSPTSTAASTVQKVLGSTDKIGFQIPGSLAAGSYYVSVSGIDSNSVTFSSSNCSALTVLPGVSPTLTLTVNPLSSSDWIINNGALTIDFNPSGGAIWSVIPTGTQDELVDFSPGDASHGGVVYDPADGESTIGGNTLPSNWPGNSGIPGLSAQLFNKEPKGFYMDNSGAGTGGTGVGHYVLTDSYLDFWTDYSAASTGNVEYDIHYVVTPNDPGIHIYFAMNHQAGQGSTSVGQIQWIFRDNPYQFTNFYNQWADLSMSSPVITQLPSVDDCFSAVNGRNVEDQTGRDTIDLHPDLGTGPGTGVYNGFDAEQQVSGAYPNPNASTEGQVPPGFHRNFCVKYDYSGYEYIHPAHGLFGSKYGLWVVLNAGHDTLPFGPGKQNLELTGNILTIEAESDHYQTGFTGISYATGAVLWPYFTGWTPAWTQTQTQAQLQTERLFGPFYVRINQFGGNIQTPTDMYNDAITAAASFTNFYNNETELLASGYIPTNARGSVSVQVNGVDGNPRTAWAVLSQPGVNHIFSGLTPTYTMDISATGSGTFTNVVPGQYRLSVYKFGQFGEYRNDSIVVAANQTTAAPMIAFQPETVGTVIGTIGTPDRSSHEFLHGANTVNYPDQPLGFDDREYYGNWNYWLDWANTASPGAPVYYLTNGPGYTATNNPLAWNYAHWNGYNPALYGGAYSTTYVSTDAYQTYPGNPGTIPAYVATLSGHSGTNGANTQLPPWQIHFATPSGDAGSNQYVILTAGYSASQGGEKVILNGTTALTYTPPSKDNSDAIQRSGLSGVYQFVVYQWPIADLNPAGQDNVITTQYNATSGTDSQISDDALTVSLSPTSAQPSITGWHDYQFIAASGAGTTTAVNDAVPNQ